MRASANRTQDNESRAVANNVSCKREERQAVQFVDNSPHTKRIAQLQAMMDKSMNPHQVQLRKFREMIDNSPQRKKVVLPGVVQKKGPLDEEELQFKSKEAVQKKGPLDEEELQFKKDEAVQRKGPLDEDELQFKAEEPVQKQENKTGLPDDLKAGVENMSGMAMDDVRVHYNSGKPAQLNAYAYTQGTEIHVAPGQEKHLPHEAWHVVQQKQGRVQPTVQMAGGVAVNDDAGLEKEADVIGEKAFQFVNTRPGTVQLRMLRRIATINSSKHQKRDLSPIITKGTQPVNLIQFYRTSKQAGQDGEFVPAYDAAIHCHIGRQMRSPHLNIRRNRYNFGKDYNLKQMQIAYEALIGGDNENLEGYADCKEYLEEQGCKAPVTPTLIDIGREQGQYPPRLQRGQSFRDEEGNIHQH